MYNRQFLSAECIEGDLMLMSKYLEKENTNSWANGQENKPQSNVRFVSKKQSC